jgi:hypothetical protein
MSYEQENGICAEEECFCGGRPLATTREAARFLRIHQDTLKKWRGRGVGPAYVSGDGRVWYQWADIHDYLDERWREAGGRG